MEELLKVNQQLSEDNKIRAVSISDGGIPKDEELRQRWGMLVERAEKDGIAVIYSSPQMHKIFKWGGCYPYEDKNDPDNYVFTAWIEKDPERLNRYSGKIILPSDFRSKA